MRVLYGMLGSWWATKEAPGAMICLAESVLNASSTNSVGACLHGLEALTLSIFLLGHYAARLLLLSYEENIDQKKYKQVQS